MFGSVVIAISSVAPAYALTATLGPTVTEVGGQMPAIFLIGFIPMLLVAYAYRALNQVAPDAGTSFTWTVKAFGPHIGWMCGWGLVIATIIVLSNLAGVAVTFFYLFLAEVIGDADIATWGDGKLVNVATCLAFVAIATFVAYRGMTATKGVMYVLVTVQMVALALFVAFAIGKALGGDAATSIDFEWSWLSPFSVTTFSALATGLSLSIFMYWGWDAALSANEETSGSERTPGIAALISLVILGSTYVLVGDRGADVRGHGRGGRGAGQRGHRRQRVRRAGRSGAGRGAGPAAVPGRPGQLGVEPADDVHPRRAHDPCDERVQGVPGPARRDAPDAPHPQLRDARVRASGPRSSTR